MYRRLAAVGLALTTGCATVHGPAEHYRQGAELYGFAAPLVVGGVAGTLGAAAAASVAASASSGQGQQVGSGVIGAIAAGGGVSLIMGIVGAVLLSSASSAYEEGEQEQAAIDHTRFTWVERHLAPIDPRCPKGGVQCDGVCQESCDSAADDGCPPPPAPHRLDCPAFPKPQSSVSAQR